MNVKLAILSAAFGVVIVSSAGTSNAVEPLTNEQMDEVTAGDNLGTVFNTAGPMIDGGLVASSSSDIVTIQLK